MITVSYDKYLEEKNEFCEKQEAEFGTPKANIKKTERGRYCLELTWTSEIKRIDVKWIEVTERISERTSVNLHEAECPVFVWMWRTEYWNTEDGERKFCYRPA